MLGGVLVLCLLLHVVADDMRVNWRNIQGDACLPKDVVSLVRGDAVLAAVQQCGHQVGTTVARAQTPSMHSKRSIATRT